MQRKNLYLYGLAVVLFFSAAIIRTVSFNRMRSYTLAVDHSQEIITSLEKLSNHFKSAQIYSPNYEKRIAPNFYNLYKEEAHMVESELQQLNQLVQKDTHLKGAVDSISSMVREHMPILLQKNIVEVIDAGEGWRLAHLFRIARTINELSDKEEKKLTERRKYLVTLLNQTNVVSWIFSSIALIIFFTSFISNYQLSKRRRWLEGFLESILDTSPYGVLSYEAVKDSKGEITDFVIDYANPAIARLLGKSVNELLGKRVDELGKYVREHLFPYYVQVVITGQRQSSEILFRDRWYVANMVKRGNGLTVSFQDITPLKQYQRDLETTVQQLERSNAELEQYAYAASHDLQEPLRKITTFSNYIWERKKESFDEKEKAYFQKILSSATRMTALVRDLLNFSSLKKETAYTATDLNESVESVLQDLDLLIQQKEAQVYVEPLPQIEAVPLQMQQLFYNLINNALKFTRPERKPEIRISARKLNPEETQTRKGLLAHLPYIEVAVTDNGIGFSDEYAEQIFGLFKRLHGKNEYHGSGVGLALCQRVAENHHGTIYAKGEAGKGARFYVVLPVRQGKGAS